MMSGVIDPGDRFAKMLTQASPGIMDFQRAMGKGQLSAEQQVRGYKQQEKSIDNYLSKFSDEQIARDANLTQLREYQASLKKYKTMNYDDAVKEQKTQNEITRAMASFGQIFQTIKGKIMTALVESKVFEKLEGVLQKIAEKFNKYAPKIGDFLADFIDGIDKAITGEGSLMDGISAAFGAMFAKLTPIVKDLFRSLFEGLTGKSDKRKELENKKSQITSKLQNASEDDQGNAANGKELEEINKQLAEMDKADPFSGLMDSMKSAFPIIGIVEKAVDALGWAFDHLGVVLLGTGGVIFALTRFSGVGKMLGGLGEGILTGVANGLKAFANPQTGIGALILSGAIVLIGGAVAGATWMMGKALPTFAEGMKSFESLNGNALIDAGKGIGAVGAGLAVFGAGSFVGGIGGMIGSWAEALTGGKSLVEKLQDFQKMDLDAARIENNATAVVAYGKAMAALGAGGAIGSLGGLVSAVADGLTGLFGRDPIPWNQMIAFQNVQLDGAAIEKNSMAVVAYMKAMATLGAGNAVGSLGGLVSAVADGLTKFFGGNIKLPWDRMIEFQNVALDIDKIGKNSDAVIAFSKAMSSLPDIKTETSGGAFGYIGSFFSGSQVMPWDKLKEFGEVKLDGDKIKQNADILKLFGDSVKTFSSAGTSSITNVGTDFATQATGINTFTDSIKNLNKAIIDLNASLATIASSGKGLLGGGQSNLSVVSQALGGANTGSSAASEKLNTLVAELVALTKEIKDSSKDQADALKGRKDAL